MMKLQMMILALMAGAMVTQAKADAFDVEKDVPATPCAARANGESLRLADVVNLTLCQNPQTRQLYMGAMATAAEYGQAKGDYLPTIDLNAGVSHSDTNVHHEKGYNSNRMTAGLSLNWLIYDFGGREASTESVRQALNAALATRSDTLQSMIFDAAEAYYLVLAAQEEFKNSNATLESALAAYDAASKRYELGLVALSDKLQAETSYSEAQLGVTKAERALELAKGKLAVLMNFAPNQNLTLAEEEYPESFFTVPQEPDALFRAAVQNRSDIAAQKAVIKKAAATVKQQKAQNAPSLSLSAGTDITDSFKRDTHYSYGSSVGLSLNVPLFTGFKNQYRISQATYSLEKEKATLKQLENTVRHEVWTSYQNFFTAKKSYEISLTMFASAEQNAKVALGAYKAGKGNILNVLDAQSKLADVRTTKSRSFYELLIAKTNIIRKVGLINPFGAAKGF